MKIVNKKQRLPTFSRVLHSIQVIQNIKIYAIRIRFHSHFDIQLSV